MVHKISSSPNLDTNKHMHTVNPVYHHHHHPTQNFITGGEVVKMRLLNIKHSWIKSLRVIKLCICTEFHMFVTDIMTLAWFLKCGSLKPKVLLFFTPFLFFKFPYKKTAAGRYVLSSTLIPSFSSHSDCHSSLVTSYWVALTKLMGIPTSPALTSLGCSINQANFATLCTVRLFGGETQHL